MELFEILFIVFIILIPLMEGIRKSRQRRGETEDVQLPTQGTGRPRPGASDRPRHEPREMTERRPPPAPREPEPAEASDMIPDDLWEILTGERRQRPPEPELEPEEAIVDLEQEEPWREVPDRRWREEPEEEDWREKELPEPDLEPVMEERFEPGHRPAPPPPERRPARAVQPTHAHREPEPLSTRRRRPSLRDLTDEVPAPARESSPLMRTLQSPQGLRDAILLREILGPPKGLNS